jgi:soluble lytic murein transglycosylase-like protein
VTRPIELFEKQIRETAARYRLDGDLVLAIFDHESGGDPYAARFEPAFSYFSNPAEWASRLGISRPTEETFQRTSWGLSQIMGACARERGFTGPLQRLCEPQNAIELGCMHLDWLRVQCVSESDLIASYNGGWGALKKLPSGFYRNERYVDDVSARLREIRAAAFALPGSASPSLPAPELPSGPESVQVGT